MYPLRRHRDRHVVRFVILQEEILPFRSVVFDDVEAESI